MVTAILLTVPAYLTGAIPVAYVLGKWLRGSDIRALGNGNVGAVNAFRQFGWRIGAIVLLADVSKGAGVVVAGHALQLPEWGVLVSAFAVTVGHNWSPYIGFRGGKGLATVFGISLAMVPVLSLLTLPVVMACSLLTRSVAWGAAGGFVTLNSLVAATGQSAAMIAMCLLLSALVAATHFYRSLPEIKRVLRHHDLKALGAIE